MSLKQVIDEIVKKIRKTEPERQSEDLENAKEQSGKTEPDRSSTSPAVVQVKKPDRQVVPTVAQLQNNNWRKMHGIPMKRDCAKNKTRKMTIEKMCQILTRRYPTFAEELAPLYMEIWIALENGKQVITVEKDKTGQYVRIDTCNTFDAGLETMVFRCDQNGEVKNWEELDDMHYGNVTEATEGHIRMWDKWTYKGETGVKVVIG